jgi:hypothetical protein
VRALLGDQTVPFLAVLEEHKILAQEPDLLFAFFIDLKLRR